jgi:hypothetical protein
MCRECAVVLRERRNGHCGSTSKATFEILVKLHRVINNSLCTWWLQHTSFLPHYLAQSYCLAADRQGQGDTRLTLTPSVITNSKYATMVSDWNCLKCFVCFCIVFIRCTETFWSPCCNLLYCEQCFVNKPLKNIGLHLTPCPYASKVKCDINK